MSDQPKPTGEWTVEQLMAIWRQHYSESSWDEFVKFPLEVLASHNAALDAAIAEAVRKAREQWDADRLLGATRGAVKGAEMLRRIKELESAHHPLVDALHQIGLLAGSDELGDPPQFKLAAIARRCEKELAKVKDGK